MNSNPSTAMARTGRTSVGQIGFILVLVAAALSVSHTGENLDWFAASGTLLIAGTLLGAYGTTWSFIRLSPPFLALLAYWLWMVAVAVFSAPAGFNATAAVYLFGALPIAWLSVSLSPDSARIWTWLGWLCVAMGLVLVAWQLVQLLSGRGYMSGPMRNENSLGGLLLVLTFTGAGFLLSRGMRLSSLAGIAALAWVFCMAIGLGLTGSRAIPLILVGALVVMAVVLRGRQRQRLGALAVAVLLGAIAAQFMDPREVDYLSRTVATVGAPGQEGAPRLAIWQGTLEMIADHWQWGVGPGAFWLVYPEYRLPADRSAGLYAHNDYLQAFAETGVIGGVLFLLWVVTLAWMAWRVFRQDLSRERRFELAGIAGGVAAVLAFSLLTFNFYILATLMFMGLVLGTFERLGETDGTRGFVSLPHPPLSRRAGLTVIVLLALFPLNFLVRVGWSYYNVETARVEASQGDLLAADRHLSRAMDLVPSQELPRMFRAQLMNEALKRPGTLTPAEQRGILRDALGWVKQARRRNPLRSEIYHVHAEMLASHVDLLPDGQRADIQYIASIYARGLERNPLNYRLRMDYARFLHESGDSDRVTRVLAQGMKYGYPAWPSVIEYYRLTEHFLAAAGREAEATSARERIERAERSYAAVRQRDRMLPGWAKPFVEHL